MDGIKEKMSSLFQQVFHWGIQLIIQRFCGRFYFRKKVNSFYLICISSFKYSISVFSFVSVIFDRLKVIIYKDVLYLLSGINSNFIICYNHLKYLQRLQRDWIKLKTRIFGWMPLSYQKMSLFKNQFPYICHLS